MAGYDGTIRVNTRLDNSGFNAGARQLNTGINGVLKSVKSLTGALGVGLSLVGIIQLGKQAVELASNIQEVQNVVDTAFDSMAYKMEAFADTCIEQFGLSKLSAKQMGSTFMAMAANMIPSMEQASDMAVALTGRAADMASFYNKTAEETATALNAVFTGETEVLKQYGVIMTETNLQQYAYQQGIKKTLADMSQAEKVQLRYNYVMEQTALAGGDFAKTSDSWANQTRILSEQFKELLSVLGSGLITVLTPAIKGLNQLLSYLIEVANTLGTIFSRMLGMDSVQISAGGSAAADAYAGATDSVDEYADAVDKANESSVANFDELTMLNAGSASGGTDTSFDVSSAQAYTTEVVEGEAAVSEMEQAIQRIIDNMQRLAGAIKSGLVDLLQSARVRLSGVIEDFVSIKDTVTELFSDGAIVEALAGLGLSVLDYYWEIAGSIATIGTSIVENLVGGIDYALQADGETLKESLLSIFDIVGDIYIIAGTWISALADVFSVIGGENGQTLTGGLIGLFLTSFAQLTELAATVGRDIMSALARPLIENKDAIATAFDGILGVLSGYVATIRENVDYAFSGFNEVYEEHIAPLIESIGGGLSYLVGVFLEFWNTHVQPMLEEWGEYFSAVIEEHVKPAIDSTMKLIGKLADALSLLWNGFIVPFIDWIIRNVLPVILPIIETIGKNVMNFFGIVSDVFGGVMEVLSSLIDFVVGVFTGDWELAWEGISGAVKGAINIVIDCINGMIRGLFNGINGVVDLINGLLDFIPEDLRVAVGIGELTHFNPPQIPRLATGTVVPPGMSQFLAILGDNNKETEVVSPLSTMKEAVAEVIAEMGGFGQDGDIVITIDGEELLRIMRNKNREYKKATGKSAFE